MMKDERDLSELIEIIPDAALVVNQQREIVLVNQLAAVGECTVEAILRIADDAMYKSKRAGKNQITTEQLTL
ncbi:hypothetical protein ACQ5ES_01025 [Pseudidiomarina sp. E22-M8]|uniref:hypothetical protein n=1 Tax=Pseudidiomarina sp. E22-M8 TaxID=3424768 RepID=UPI00403CE1E6